MPVSLGMVSDGSVQNKTGTNFPKPIAQLQTKDKLQMQIYRHTKARGNNALAFVIYRHSVSATVPELSLYHF